jgi:hypothetical protein
VGNQYGRGSFSFSTTPTWDPATSTQGDGFASFLLGSVTLTEVAAQIAAVQYRQTSFAVYFDDVWKITPKLTLSLGLRYENTPPWTDQTGNLTTVFYNAYDTTPNVADLNRYPIFLRQGKGNGDPYSGLKVRWPNITLVQDGRLGDSLVLRDNNDFAPRIGIARSPNPKWAIRAAAGTFYNQDQGNPWFDVGRNAAGRSRNDDNPSFPAEVANFDWNSVDVFANDGRDTPYTTSCGPLQQPDKQKLATSGLPRRRCGLRRCRRDPTSCRRVCHVSPGRFRRWRTENGCRRPTLHAGFAAWLAQCRPF